MKTDWQSASEDEVYRLIGKFTVAFSNLICLVELALVGMLCPGNDEQQQNRAQALVHGNTARNLLDWFFAALRVGRDWTPADHELVDAVRKKCEAIVSLRNRIAHDAWSLGHPNAPVPAGAAAWRYHYRTSPKDGPSVRPQEVTLQDLRDWITRVQEATELVRTLMISIPAPERTPSSLLRFDGGEVRIDRAVG